MKTIKDKQLEKLKAVLVAVRKAMFAMEALPPYVNRAEIAAAAGGQISNLRSQHGIVALDIVALLEKLDGDRLEFEDEAPETVELLNRLLYAYHECTANLSTDNVLEIARSHNLGGWDDEGLLAAAAVALALVSGRSAGITLPAQPKPITDPYRILAANRYDIAPSEVSKETRDEIKARVLLALSADMVEWSDATFAEDARRMAELSGLDAEAATRVVESYFRAFPGVRQFFHDQSVGIAAGVADMKAGRVTPVHIEVETTRMRGDEEDWQPEHDLDEMTQLKQEEIALEAAQDEARASEEAGGATPPASAPPEPDASTDPAPQHRRGGFLRRNK